MALGRFNLQHTALLVVDVQEKLLPHIHNADALVSAVGKMIDAAAVLGLPIIVTEQYRRGLGETVPALRQRLDGAAGPFEKKSFSACIEPVLDQLSKQALKSVLVCGIEAHVCVAQTCLDLLDGGYVTGLLCDAIGSRRERDQAVAETRLVQAGVTPTTVESAILEMVRSSDHESFKHVLLTIK